MYTNKKFFPKSSSLKRCTSMSYICQSSTCANTPELPTVVSKIKTSIYPDSIFGYWNVFLGIHWPFTRLRYPFLLHLLGSEWNAVRIGMCTGLEAMLIGLVTVRQCEMSQSVCNR